MLDASASSARPRPSQGGSALVLWLGVWLLLGAACFMAANAAWQLWFVGRIFPGVSVSHVPLSGLTRREAGLALQASGLSAPTQPVLASRGDRHWVLDGQVAATAQDLEALVDAAYRQGRDGALARNVWNRWRLLWQGVNLMPDAVFAAPAVDRFVQRVAADMATPPRAAVAIGAAQWPARPGTVVDTEALVRALGRALADGTPRAVTVELAASPPAPPAPAAATAMPAPLLVTHAQAAPQFALDPAFLATALAHRDPRQADTDALARRVRTWAPLFASPPRDVTVRFDETRGALTVVEPSRVGVALDVEGTVQAIVAALAAGRPEAELQLRLTPPALTHRDLPALGIRERVGRSVTYFQGSSAARVHNIDLTTQQFAGVLIPPGAAFSFNETVGPITVAAGYADAAIIWGDRTAVGVGGGVCQVSTTIFRAALHAGLPIEERHNHGYVVSWYGLPGQDATIYTPHVDLKFRNDTAAYLLLQPVLDTAQGVLAFDLFGTRPDRTVRLTEPRISRRVEPPAPVYLEDPSLPPGATRLAETAKQGSTVVVERLITENGATRTERFVSVYQPWRAVYLVGPQPGATDAASVREARDGAA